jgi:RIO kinase 2
VQNARYDGYRLTYGGLDYLALHAHVKADSLFSVGQRIGVGKEADVMVCAAPDTEERRGNAAKMVLKMHRLGRISFRNVKEKRDYLGRGKAAQSWMHLSQLAAQKEYAVLYALYDAGFPVPTPRGWNRHTVLMDLVDGTPLRNISSVPDPAALYGELIEIVVRLARHGLIHGDFNEFNILVEEITNEETEEITLVPIVIDFPQAVSTTHTNAKYYFDRDIACLKRFFERRFHFIVEESGPTLEDALKESSPRRLDVEVEASGFSRKMDVVLQQYIEATAEAENEEGVNDKEEPAEQEDAPIDTADQVQTTTASDDHAPMETKTNQEEEDRTSSWVDGIAAMDPSNKDAQLILSDLKSPQTVEDKENDSTPKEDVEDKLEKMTLASRMGGTSIAGSTRTRKSVNPLKVSRGWAI